MTEVPSNPPEQKPETTAVRSFFSSRVVSVLILGVVILNFIIFSSVKGWFPDRRYLFYLFSPKYLPRWFAGILWILTAGEWLAFFCFNKKTTLTPIKPSTESQKINAKNRLALSLSRLIRLMTYFCAFMFFIDATSLPRYFMLYLKMAAGFAIHYTDRFIRYFYFVPSCDYFYTGKLSWQLIAFGLMLFAVLVMIFLYSRRWRRLSLSSKFSSELALIFMLPLPIFLLLPSLPELIEEYSVGGAVPMFSESTLDFVYRYIPAIVAIIVGCYLESFFRLQWTVSRIKLLASWPIWLSIFGQISRLHWLKRALTQLESSPFGRILIQFVCWFVGRFRIEKLPMTIRYITLILVLWLLVTHTELESVKRLFS